MKFDGKTVGYWAATGLVALGFVAGGFADLTHAPPVAASMTSLGYPAYFMTILGTWKLLGAVGIAIPKFPRLKEWAYAGIAFDLSGAVLSHLMSGQADKIAAPAILLLIAAASYVLRPASRKLSDNSAQTSAANEPRVGAVAGA